MQIALSLISIALTAALIVLIYKSNRKTETIYDGDREGLLEKIKQSSLESRALCDREQALLLREEQAKPRCMVSFIDETGVEQRSKPFEPRIGLNYLYTSRDLAERKAEEVSSGRPFKFGDTFFPEGSGRIATVVQS